MSEVVDNIDYQIDSGDPIPKQKSTLSPEHRAKLDTIVQTMVKNKESDKVIQAVVNDFKSKYSTTPIPSPQPKQEQPAFQIQLSQPTFKSAPTKTGAREFTYTKPSEPLDIYKLQGKAREAQESIQKEIEGNNDVKIGLVKHRSTLQKMGDQNAAITPDIAPTNIKQDINKLGLVGPPPTPKPDVRTDEEDLKIANNYIASDRNNASAFLNEVSKSYPEKAKTIQKNTYLIDAFNSAANDPNGNERVNKIQENAKAIEKGDLLYDHKNETLIKPEGFFSSLFEARKELNKVSDAYDRTKLMQDNGNLAGIISELNAKLKGGDPDEPKRVPQGALGELGHMLGGQTIKGLAAGAVSSIGVSFLGNPEAAPTAFELASGAMNAVDMYKIGKQNALEQNYIQLKSEHPEMPDYDAYTQANELAEKQAIVDAAAAGAMQYLGAKVGFGASKQLTKGLASGLSQIKDDIGKKAFEAAGIGGIGSASQVIKNIMAQQNGLNTPTSEGALDAFKSGVLMTGAMAMLGIASNQLKSGTRNRLSYGLGQMSDEALNNGLNKLEQSGQLTSEQIENVRNIIKEQKTFEQLIPENLPESDRLKIGGKIKERSELKQQLEQVDEAFHPEIKEKIKKLNEDIISISKGEQRGELQQLVKRSIENNEVQGFAIEPLQHAGEGELKQYLKEIAEQAHDPNSEATTIATFGKNIVNKAKELYPKEQPKVSVIQPGEIKHPETVTISPREQPKEIKSTKNVSVIMPGDISAGKVSSEQIGHVEISEHGEDTKTAAGKENGIGPAPLTKEGQQEAQKLGQYIADNNKTKIITSEVERGLQTAEEAAKEATRITGKEVPIERNELLNTANIGSDEGKPEGTFKEKEWFEGKYLPEGAETPDSFKERMEKAYEYVKSLPEDTHVVSHSKVMRAIDALSKTDGKWTDETTNIFLNNKELIHAKDVRGNQGQLPEVGQIGRGSQEIGGYDIQQISPEPPISGETEQQAREPAQESKTSGAEKKTVAELKVDDAYGLPFIDEPSDKKTGIKNVISKATRFERRLPSVDVKKLGSDQEILLEGKRLVDDNVINPVDIVNRILDTKEGMQPDEAKAMQYYMHQLGQQETNLRERLADATDEVDRANINGQLQQLSDEIDAATQANIISGKAWSDVGNIRQVVSDTGFNASRDMATIKDAYGGKVPKDVQIKLDKALKERDEALNKLAKLQAEEKNKAAENTIKKEGAPRNSKKTKEDFKNERTEIKKSISDKLKKGRSGESGLTAVPLPFAKELIAISPEIFKLVKSYAEEGIQKTEEVINRLHDVLKDEIDGIQKSDIVNLLAGRYKAEGENVSKVSQRIRDYRTEANLWTKIAEATKMEEDTPAKKQEKNKKLEDLRDRLNDIRKRNNEAIAQAKDILATDVQKELKKLTRQRRALETRYKTKKYLVPNEKTSSPISAEIIKEKQRIVNANYKIRIEKRKAFESKKNFYQKSLMWTGRMIRLSVLSGYNVLAKLAAAATIGGAGKRIPEQAIGFIYGNAFKGISERAPIEGFVNAAAEAKFYKEFLNPKTFAKNTWEILKSGESPLSKKFSPGTYEHIPGLYLPTDLHQIIKDPLKRATYEASLKNALAWAERNGMDINDDLVIQSLETAAYKRAQYEIFQEQNWLSKRFGEWKHNMEESGNLGATGKFLADFMIPVSTVPTNIARRMVTTSPFGLIRGTIKVIEAYRKGIESLTPEQADSIMKQLKQGTLGTALWLIGWYGYAQFGGLYSKFNPNKERDQGDLMSDEMSVGGQMVPKPVQHALPLEIIQFAATARRVYDNYSDHKGASTPESIEKAGLASIGALTEQIPIVETIAHTIGAFTNPYEAKKLEEDVRRRFEPQILRETGIIGKDKGGSSVGAGATSAISREKPTRIKRAKVNPHKR